MLRQEENLHLAVCRYLKMQYPEVIFLTELGGIKLPPGLAKKASQMRSCRGLPDLLVLEPRLGYYGMFLELKKEGSSPYKKDGTLKSDEHLWEQEKVLQSLCDKGYYAIFAVGFDEAKQIIDTYLQNKTK
jgi:hypothetical protein